MWQRLGQVIVVLRVDLFVGLNGVARFGGGPCRRLISFVFVNFVLSLLVKGRGGRSGRGIGRGLLVRGRFRESNLSRRRSWVTVLGDRRFRRDSLVVTWFLKLVVCRVS